MRKSVIQNLEFRLMQKASFNNFDGEQVVKDLKSNPDLWEGVIMDREGFKQISLIKLRDISQGYWNVDTVFVLSVPGKEEELERLAKHWSADEVEWLGEEESGQALGSWPSRKKAILRVWWD